MAYNPSTANRITDILDEKNIKYSAKTMFMGIVYMVDDKLMIGTHIDKATGEDILLCRVSDDVFQKSVELPDVEPMKMNKRISKNYLFVGVTAFKTKSQLSKWIQYTIDYNPVAKASKKK